MQYSTAATKLFGRKLPRRIQLSADAQKHDRSAVHVHCRPLRQLQSIDRLIIQFRVLCEADYRNARFSGRKPGLSLGSFVVPISSGSGSTVRGAGAERRPGSSDAIPLVAQFEYAISDCDAPWISPFLQPRRECGSGRAWPDPLANVVFWIGDAANVTNFFERAYGRVFAQRRADDRIGRLHDAENQTYDYWFVGANFSRPLGRTLGLTFSYQLEYQIRIASFCIGPTCGTERDTQLISSRARMARKATAVF